MEITTNPEAEMTSTTLTQEPTERMLQIASIVTQDASRNSKTIKEAVESFARYMEIAPAAVWATLHTCKTYVADLAPLIDLELS